MNKIIEKCENYKMKTINKAIEKAKKQYEEARGNYNDTGQDRYYNKMLKLTNEIGELNTYLNSNDAIKEYRGQALKAQHDLLEMKTTIKNKLFYLLEVLPDCSEATSIKLWLEKN